MMHDVAHRRARSASPWRRRGRRTRPGRSSCSAPSIMRWKFQRSRIGKLPTSVWCLSVVCSATSSGLAARIAGQQQQRAALLRPQLRRLHVAQPVDDVAQHREQQRLERADDGGQQRHAQHEAAHAGRAGPDEREEALGRRRRLGVRARGRRVFRSNRTSEGLLVLAPCRSRRTTRKATRKSTASRDAFGIAAMRRAHRPRPAAAMIRRTPVPLRRRRHRARAEWSRPEQRDRRPNEGSSRRARPKGHGAQQRHRLQRDAAHRPADAPRRAADVRRGRAGGAGDLAHGSGRRHDRSVQPHRLSGDGADLQRQLRRAVALSAHAGPRALDRLPVRHRRAADRPVGPDARGRAPAGQLQRADAAELAAAVLRDRVLHAGHAPGAGRRRGHPRLLRRVRAAARPTPTPRMRRRIAR